MPKTIGGQSPKRMPLSMRTTEELRRRLEQAALQSGRSLAQEVESRLEDSFDSFDLIERLFGGKETTNLLMMISMTIRMAEVRTGCKWHEDAHTQRIVVQAIQNIAEVILPSGDREAGLGEAYRRIIAMEADVIATTTLRLMADVGERTQPDRN